MAQDLISGYGRIPNPGSPSEDSYQDGGSITQIVR